MTSLLGGSDVVHSSVFLSAPFLASFLASISSIGAGFTNGISVRYAERGKIYIIFLKFLKKIFNFKFFFKKEVQKKKIKKKSYGKFIKNLKQFL